MSFTVKASQVLVRGKPFEQLIGTFAVNFRNCEKYHDVNNHDVNNKDMISGFTNTVSKNSCPAR